MEKKVLQIPVTEDETRKLRIGDVVYLTGHIFTSRDMAHLRLRKMYEKGEKLPKDFKGAVIFHAGPVCLKNEDGSWRLNVIGPTTSIRMEPHADFVGKLGVKILVGKGGMEKDTIEACKKYGYVYLQAAPGCAAKLAEGIVKVNDVTWFELGMPEALWDLQAVEFGPLVVGMDSTGASIYKNIKEKALEKLDTMYPPVK
jgi:tartrate/fumarate subfamily iron-sulfur-dependent hydro-lyase beta chain